MKFKNSRNLHIITVFLLVSFVGSGFAATLGTQQYRLIGKSGNCIFIGEDIGGESWNRKMDKAGIVKPSCHGFEAKNSYYYPRGLYINYEISKAFFFERSGIVLLFTTNPHKATGLDTMHGFIVLQ